MAARSKERILKSITLNSIKIPFLVIKNWYINLSHFYFSAHSMGVRERIVISHNFVSQAFQIFFFYPFQGCLSLKFAVSTAFYSRIFFKFRYFPKMIFFKKFKEPLLNIRHWFRCVKGNRFGLFSFFVVALQVEPNIYYSSLSFSADTVSHLCFMKRKLP